MSKLKKKLKTQGKNSKLNENETVFFSNHKMFSSTVVVGTSFFSERSSFNPVDQTSTMFVKVIQFASGVSELFS